MKRDTEKTRKRRKKKSKFGYYLYAVVILVLTIANITVATLLVTYVQQVQVKGNVNSKEKEIVAWVREDPLTANSLYTLWKFKSGSYTLPIYLESVNVSLKAPWKVQVNVAEKQIIGCIISDGSYVYFDAEGLVLKNTSTYEQEVPIIEGIKADNTLQYETMQVDNKKVFSYIVDITEGMRKNELHPERIVWEEDSMNLYFGGICAKLGKTNFDEKLVELPALLEKVPEESGTFHLEHYTKENTRISFEKNT